MFISGVTAALAGGAGVMLFTEACDALRYTAETSGQVAVGTATYALVRQLVDSLWSVREQRSLRRPLAAALHGYVAAVRANKVAVRNFSALEERIRELRNLHSAFERDIFDQAIDELRSHGTATDFAVLNP